MTAVPTTTMTDFVDAVLSGLRAHAWPSPIATIGYRQPEDLVQQDPEALDTPALLLSIPSRSAAESPRFPGTAPRRCVCELYCLLSLRTERTAVELLELAEAVTQLLEQRDISTAAPAGSRWGLGAAAEYPESIGDSESTLSLPGIAITVVTWEQTLYLPALAPLTN